MAVRCECGYFLQFRAGQFTPLDIHGGNKVGNAPASSASIQCPQCKHTIHISVYVSRSA